MCKIGEENKIRLKSFLYFWFKWWVNPLTDLEGFRAHIGPWNKHTYLARKIPWSSRRFFQGEALPLHIGRVDPCDHPKCGWLECVIFSYGDCVRAIPFMIMIIEKHQSGRTASPHFPRSFQSDLKIACLHFEPTGCLILQTTRYRI